jgi:hypothetical protein
MCFLRKPDPVKPYMERLLGDEKWQGYFDPAQISIILSGAEAMLCKANELFADNKADAGVMDDTYQTILAMIGAAESFDVDDR